MGIGCVAVINCLDKELPIDERGIAP